MEEGEAERPEREGEEQKKRVNGGRMYAFHKDELNVDHRP